MRVKSYEEKINKITQSDQETIVLIKNIIAKPIKKVPQTIRGKEKCDYRNKTMKQTKFTGGNERRSIRHIYPVKGREKVQITSIYSDKKNNQLSTTHLIKLWPSK